MVPGVLVDHGNRSLGYELAGEGVSVWAYRASVCVCGYTLAFLSINGRILAIPALDMSLKLYCSQEMKAEISSKKQWQLSVRDSF